MSPIRIFGRRTDAYALASRLAPARGTLKGLVKRPRHDARRRLSAGAPHDRILFGAAPLARIRQAWLLLPAALDFADEPARATGSWQRERRWRRVRRLAGALRRQH